MGPKINQLKKTEEFLGQKKTGAELKHKKWSLWVKNWEKFGNKVQKLTNLTEKMDFSGKKKLGLSLSKDEKRHFFGPKIGKKLSIRTKFDQFFPKKKILWAKNYGKNGVLVSKIDKFPHKS